MMENLKLEAKSKSQKDVHVVAGEDLRNWQVTRWIIGLFYVVIILKILRTTLQQEIKDFIFWEISQILDEQYIQASSKLKIMGIPIIKETPQGEEIDIKANLG